VSVHGERHAPVHPDIPSVANTAFLVSGAVFHPETPSPRRHRGGHLGVREPRRVSATQPVEVEVVP
jgi:hypothetical protein